MLTDSPAKPLTSLSRSGACHFIRPCARSPHSRHPGYQRLPKITKSDQVTEGEQNFTISLGNSEAEMVQFLSW